MNLKIFRQQLGKTQEEVAKKNNITQTTYSNYETGKTDPDIETLKKLADYFHKSVDDLIGFTRTPSSTENNLNLKTIRKQQKLTQTDVAKQLNIDYTTIGRYENGITEPNIDTLKKLAKLYHTSIDNLVGHETPFVVDKSKFSTTQLELIEKIAELSQRQCELVNVYITVMLAAEQDRINIINKINKGE